ncbi:HNH endonuclease [Cupriavidus pauculus]|uniref:HNH endonuclease n=1 Tax=Cupriavidus pauculus TaxID=82633 RepID=UPI001C936D1A|nr:HNH endonuclease [Cupriavidus pauculus]MBY4730781.1 HNH endonuclease [Cupriavidus pauculus]
MTDFVILKTAKGVEFKVSPEDYERVSAHAWYVNEKGYVMRSETYATGKRRPVRLHRFILGVSHDDDVLVDHENRDKLDNRRGNLRVCTPAQNNHNAGLVRANTSGFKGVCPSGTGSWRVQIGFGGDRIHLGYFEAPELGAHAYNKAAIQLHGEFAVLNPVGGVYVE